MTKLELVQLLWRECGVSGPKPTTTVNATGELGRLVGWIEDAWTEIQELHSNWDWMSAEFSFQTQAGKYEYSAEDIGLGDVLANWREGDDSMRSHLTAAGVGSQLHMSNLEYYPFRDYYLFGTRPQSYSQPREFAVTPAKTIVLGPNPGDQIYTITGLYYTLPVALSADAAVPTMPARFHKLIVYRAMQDYGEYEAAPEVLSRGIRKYREMLSSLRGDQLPQVSLGGALA